MTQPGEALSGVAEGVKSGLEGTQAAPTLRNALAAPKGLARMVGEQLERAAGAARGWAPPEGPMARVVSVVAERMEGASRLLQQRAGGQSSRRLDVLTAQVRRYPLQFLIVGVAAGYVLVKLAGSRQHTPKRRMTREPGSAPTP